MSMIDALSFNQEQQPNECNIQQTTKKELKHQEPDEEFIDDKQSIRISIKNDDDDVSQMEFETANNPSNTSSYKNEIHSILKNVFLNYAKYSYEDKSFLLSYQTLTKLLTNMNIITTVSSNKGFHMKPCEFDILAKQISPKKLSKLNLTQFINVIVILSSKYKPSHFKSNSKKALYNFVKKYFHPISEFINTLNPEDEPSPFLYRQIQRDIESTLTKVNTCNKTKQILTHVHKGIMFLYKLYFPYEIGKRSCLPGSQTLEKESLISLVSLSKTFDLMPQLVSVEKIAIYYYCLMDIKNIKICTQYNNIGKLFTFSKFCIFLICLSDCYFGDISEELWSRFVLLLKKMEDSHGKVKTENNFHVMRPQTCCLEVDYELQMKLMSNEEEETLFDSGNIQNEDKSKCVKEVNLKMMSPSKTQFNYDNKSKYQSSFLQMVQSERGNEYEDIQYKGNDWMLLNIFDMYTAIGDKLNFSQMTYTGFLKMLKDFGIIDTKIITTVPQLLKDVNSNSQHNNDLLNRHKSMGSLKSYNSRIHNYFTEIDASIIFYEICGAKHIKHEKSILNENDLTLTTTKSTCLDLTSGNVAFRMKFPQFYQALRLISKKIYPELELNIAFEQFKLNQLNLKEYTENADSSYRHLIETIYAIQISDVRNILNELYGLVHIIYTTYADSSNMINFQRFILLLKDFSVFPDVVTLLEIKKMFFAMCKLYREQSKSGLQLEEFIKEEIKRGNKQNSNDTYDELFTKLIKNELGDSEYLLYILIICSKSIKSKLKENDIQKLIFLFEKMGSSQGVNNPRKFTGNGKLECLNKSFVNIIRNIKNKYPKYFSYKKDKVKDVYKNEDMLSYLFKQDD